MNKEGGLISFAIDGSLLLFGVYYILENTNKPFINTGLFATFFVFPIGLVVFLLLGLGLFSVIKSTQAESNKAPKVREKDTQRT